MRGRPTVIPSLTSDRDVVAVLTVVTAPPPMTTAAEVRLISKTHDIIQPDSTGARTVCVAQCHAAVSANTT